MEQVREIEYSGTTVHSINPDSRPYLCRGHSVEGYYDTFWLTVLWSTQAKVEGIMLKAAWHWCSDGSVFNGPLGEPGCTPMYVRILSTWGFVDGYCMFHPISWESSLTGDCDRYK